MKFRQPMSRWRLHTVCVALIAMPLALAWHLAHLQVIPSESKDFRFLQDEGEARTVRVESIPAYRGVITDRNGELLAVSTPVKSIVINPQRFEIENISRLADALNIKKQDLANRLSRYENKQFMYLQRHMPPHEADQVLALKISGVWAEEEFRRFYPAGEVAAHVVGFTDIDDEGSEGIELSFNNHLAGEPGSKRLVKDLKGNVVKDLGLIASPKSGRDLALTIDLRLQYLAFKELKNAIAQQGAKSGSIVMMDVDSGDILAMVNQPAYNPNNRSGLNPSQLRNRAFTDVFEPGSTMKPFTVMAALESGKYTENYKIDTNPGHVFIAGKMIPDPVNYGVIDLTKVIAKSSQVGISKLAMEMDPDAIRNMYFRAGLGQSTGAGFPGESVGLLPSHNKWHPLEKATFAYGYGLSVNAVQLAQAYSMIAADGVFHQANLLLRESPVKGSQVVAASVAKKMKAMLKAVVSPGGTAVNAALAAYPVAGKTGTAHKISKQGYADDKYIALFAGFAPIHDPKIVTVVVIDEPPSDGDYSGGKSAAPVFANIMDKALRTIGLPPRSDKTAVALLETEQQSHVFSGELASD